MVSSFDVFGVLRSVCRSPQIVMGYTANIGLFFRAAKFSCRFFAHAYVTRAQQVSEKDLHPSPPGDNHCPFSGLGVKTFALRHLHRDVKGEYQKPSHFTK